MKKSPEKEEEEGSKFLARMLTALLTEPRMLRKSAQSSKGPCFTLILRLDNLVHHLY
jgi:hypothetical protein